MQVKEALNFFFTYITSHSSNKAVQEKIKIVWGCKFILLIMLTYNNLVHTPEYNYGVPDTA